MSISLWVGENSYQIGTSSFLKCFFSTVYTRCENLDWGARFPTIMNDFYSGELAPDLCQTALEELTQIQRCFANYSPEEIVWDFENPLMKAPWGDDISPTIDSMADYFLTSEGSDLFEVFRSAFTEASKSGEIVVIR